MNRHGTAHGTNGARRSGGEATGAGHQGLRPLSTRPPRKRPGRRGVAQGPARVCRDARPVSVDRRKTHPLSQGEREKRLEILRAGPEQAGRLLQNAYALAGKVGGGGGGDAQVQQVYQAIKGLERVILDEPYADHQSLYANLGEAALLPEGPEGALGPRLGRALVSGARNDQGTQVLLDHLSSEQLANIILNSLGEGDVVEQVADALDAFTPDPEKAGRILSFLDLALPKAGERGVPISVAVMMKLEFPAFVAPDEAPDFAEFDEGRIAG